jgi:hypothetical protein
MKKVTRFIALAALATTLATPAFAAENTYPADTSTPRAVIGPSLHQWQAMASTEADTLAQKLGTTSGPWRVVPAAGHDSYFAQAFSKMLVSELSARGIPLTTRADTDSVIELQLDRIPHFYDKRSYAPGSLTKLAAGLWLVAGLAEITSPPVFLTALVVGEDYSRTKAKDTADSPKAELAITLLAGQGGGVAASTTHVYLLNSQATGAYADKPGSTLKFIK